MLQFIILYVLRKYGIDIEKLIRENPYILRNKKPETIKTEEEIDKILSNNIPSGLLLKYQLDLSDLKYVYIRKMLRSSQFYYEVIFDTHLNRSISQSMLRNMTFYKSFINKNNKLERRIFTPPLPLAMFTGKIPSNAIVVKLDLAGRYYTQLDENKKSSNSDFIDCREGKFDVYYKSNDCEKLNEISLSDWYENGLSDRNWEFYNQRKNEGNTKVDLSRITYNKKSGSLLIQYSITPSFIGIPNPQKDGKIEKQVTIVKKDGSTSKGKYYIFQILFEDIRSWIKTREDWLSLSKIDKIELVRDMIKNYDSVKLFSSSPSWLFQGSWKRAEELDASIHSYPGFPDSGYWASLHGTDIYASKHMIPVYQTLQFNADKIAQVITDEFEKRDEI